MMRSTLAVFIVVLSAAQAEADIYNYECRNCAYPSTPRDGFAGCEEVGPTFPLRVNDKTNLLEWRGAKYDLTIASADEPDGCAKYGWHAKGKDASFTFCTATKGYAAIEGRDGIKAQCNIRH